MGSSGKMFSVISSMVSDCCAQDQIAKDPNTHGAMFLPLIMGSDKTTVSVATGNQEFHPFYGSPGVISGIARRSHGSGVLPYSMLPIPKGLYTFDLLQIQVVFSLIFQLLSGIEKHQHLRSLQDNYTMNVSHSLSHR